MKISKLFFSFFLSVTLFAQCSWSQMVSTQSLYEQNVVAARDAKINAFLAREDVSRQLQSMGVDQKILKERVASLTDEEAKALSSKIDSLPAGGDASIIGVVVFIFVLLLITDILGLTKVFPFTRSVR